MIFNQWYVILASDEVKKNQVIGVKRLGENLIPGDFPVITYRKKREELKKQSADATTI